jgi:hypothetical protein
MSAVAPPPAPTWPSSYPPQPAARRRWPAFVAGAVLAGVTATVVTANVTASHTSTPAAPVTVTATPPAPPQPARLSVAVADRKTCNAWLSTGDKIHAASAAQSVIPQGMTILDPAVRDNPDWAAAVRKAADLYRKAGDTLAAGIAPGTTRILDQAATTAANALRTLSTGYGKFDPASGNTYSTTHEASDAMDALCERLAPR